MTYAAFPSETDPPRAISTPTTRSPWASESTCARVRKLWEDHSAGEIAKIISADLGITVKRNAVVGWLHRQKLTTEHKTKLHPLTTCTIAPRKRTRPRREPKPAGAQRPKPIPGQPFVMRCAEVEPKRISLDQLTSENCHYPYGDGPFVFCGNVALSGHSYCPAHHSLCHKGTP